MKLLMQASAVFLAASFIFMGCSDSDELIDNEAQATAVDTSEESGEDAVSGVDSAEDVATLDVNVEEEEAEVSAVQGPDVSEEEESERLDEDPTSFRSNPNPGSHFFNPEVP